LRPSCFAFGGAKFASRLAVAETMIIFRKRLPGVAPTALTRFLLRARRAAGLRGQVNVLITGNRELQELNRRFRGKNQPTDVLSFPSITSDGLAGEIAISAEIASQNARQLGHTPAEEIKILALHGVLHLAGYDHERDGGEMAAKEQRLRKKLGLPSGLIERAGRASRPIRAHP
jgi:probable rRNA maturation factor